MKTKEQAARDSVKGLPMYDRIDQQNQYEGFLAGVKWAAKGIREELQCYSEGMSVLDEYTTKQLFKEFIGENEVNE